MSESPAGELLDHGESTESGDLRRAYVRVGVVALVLVVGASAWFFLLRANDEHIAGGAASAQEFVGSFPDDFGCTEKRTPEGAWMQCWEPATSFYGCEPGEPLPDDPARKCFEPLVNYFWYADPTALDEVVTDLEENSAGCVLKSERSLVVTYSIWDQLQPTDDPKILQKVSESFTGPVEIVGDNCP